MNAIEQLPDNARIWVYQSNRVLTNSEVEYFESGLTDFLSTWKAHGKSLEAHGQVMHNLFVIIAVNETDQIATGCSIDESVRFIQQMSKQLSIDFMDRSVVIANGDSHMHLPIKEVKNKVASGDITQTSIVYNNAHFTVGEWKQNWRLPATESWLARHFT